MRLINARTFKLEQFWDERDKQYAILSHRWGDDEVSYQDMQSLEAASKMKGFAKIQKACERTIRDGLDHIWIDTCCINKESSTELSEAINSMYVWYELSAACYAFLSDVYFSRLDDNNMGDHIISSAWFTRGWTLQELLAPRQVVFYDEKWEFIGTKQTLSKLLARKTGIDEHILRGEPISNRSVAQRMSWASQRVTTRVEDTAYCLLGIFNINMPMLYGEGAKAFLRLQEEIIKQSDDHTIFAWPIQRSNQPGLLADSPVAFSKCQHTRAMSSRRGRSPFSLTNRGLSIELMATPFKVDTYLVRLDCVDGKTPADGDPRKELLLGMFLRRLDEDDQYARVEHEGETFIHLEATENWDFGTLTPLQSERPIKPVTFKVKQQSAHFNAEGFDDRVNGFRIATTKLLEPSTSGKDQYKVSAPGWDAQENIMSMKAGDFGAVGLLDIGHLGCKIRVVKLGFDFEYNPVCFLATTSGEVDLGPPRQEARQRAHGMTTTTTTTTMLLSIYQRDPLDAHAWSAIHDDGTAAELPGRPGLWALRGDRIDGLDVRIADLARLRIARAKLRNRNAALVWDLHLEDLKKASIRDHMTQFLDSHNIG